MTGRAAVEIAETVVATEVSGKGLVTQLAAMPTIWVKGKETSLKVMTHVHVHYLLTSSYDSNMLKFTEFSKEFNLNRFS